MHSHLTRLSSRFPNIHQGKSNTTKIFKRNYNCSKNILYPIKSLDWCSPYRNKRESKWSQTPITPDKSPFLPPKRFGIIAAASRNRIIGINNQLPWKIPEDHSYFEHVTRGKTLILGRCSFEESHPPGSHLSHVRRCIVVSTTINRDDVIAKVEFCVARSLAEALDMARRFSTVDNVAEETRHNCDDDLDCWVGGGERIYDEALQHPNAWELRLTKVDMDVEIDDCDSGDDCNIARFPPGYRWDHRFFEVRRWDGDEVMKRDLGFNYSFHVYKRERG